METELEQEGNENAWRTADLRIRKTQVSVCLHVVEHILPTLFFRCCFVYHHMFAYCFLMLQYWKMNKNEQRTEVQHSQELKACR